MTMLYFAYGTNMDRAAMAQRCPDARALGVARLDEHRFFFARAGYASVAPQPGAVVHGVLWRVSVRDLAALDAYENLAGGLYRRAHVTVRHGNERARAIVYLARDGRPGIARTGHPRSSVLRAARDWGFPVAYLDELAGWANRRARSVRCVPST
jgi:gamma-glutamylcyclotransferase (GGCT)/AIG2-like uncharacterized protein YtfP